MQYPVGHERRLVGWLALALSVAGVSALMLAQRLTLLSWSAAI